MYNYGTVFQNIYVILAVKERTKQICVFFVCHQNAVRCGFGFSTAAHFGEGRDYRRNWQRLESHVLHCGWIMHGCIDCRRYRYVAIYRMQKGRRRGIQNV